MSNKSVAEWQQAVVDLEQSGERLAALRLLDEQRQLLGELIYYNMSAGLHLTWDYETALLPP